MMNFGAVMGLTVGPEHAAASNKPVPPPTPIRFPRCSPQSCDTPFGPGGVSKTEFQAQLAKICRFTDVRRALLDGLNVHVIHDVGLENLVPRDVRTGESFLPPEEWDQLSHASPPEAVEEAQRRYAATAGPEGRVLSNGNNAPGPRTYMERRVELLNDNDAAYRFIQRVAPEKGQQAARVGKMYKFFKGLDLMSTFWDTSHDDDNNDNDDSVAGEKNKKENNRDGEAESGGADKMEIDNGTPEAAKSTSTFFNRRTSTGRDMPESFRSDCITGLVEVVAWEFNCQLQYVYFSCSISKAQFVPSQKALNTSN
jgi:hypothetical protein